jgi:hypothetical protein
MLWLHHAIVFRPRPAPGVRPIGGHAMPTQHEDWGEFLDPSKKSILPAIPQNLGVAAARSTRSISAATSL